jgi:hypothetical protein
VHTQSAHARTILNSPLQQHGKEYDTDEEELSRQIVWEANRNYVQNHNEHADVFGFTLAMNEFADMVIIIYVLLYRSNHYKILDASLFCIPGIQ